MHTWVVLILMVVFLWLLYRSRGGGAHSVLSFGKSQARVVENESITFADVAGVDEAIEELTEVVDFLKKPDRYVKLGARIPKGVLLVGPPGTGKTLLARAVAGEANVPFFQMAGSSFNEMFWGVGSSRVRDLFAKARAAAPCIVFIDELDALGRTRSATAIGGAQDSETTLNQLLVEMDGFDSSAGVTLMAATNRPEILDGALLRAGRFDRHIVVGLPHREGRRAILEIHLRDVTVDPDLSLDSIAARTPGFAGADLANLVNEAALLAARRNKNLVTQAEFDEAIERQQLGLQRKGLIYSPKERRIVAYHEIGHAVVGALLEGVDPLQKVTIIPRSFGSGGVTQFEQGEERHLHMESELRDHIAVALGGRAAEILFIGEPSTGAQNDLARATSLAGDMVRKFGMSSLGSRTFEATRRAFVNEGVEATSPRDHGEQTATSIDREVQKLVDEGLARAKELLEAQRTAVDKLAALLLEAQEISGTEVRKALGLPEPPPTERPARKPVENDAGDGAKDDAPDPAGSSLAVSTRA